MLSHPQTLEQEHQAISRTVALLQSIDPAYTGPVGFDADYTQWLANLDAQAIALQEAETLDDIADAQFAVQSGIPMF